MKELKFVLGRAPKDGSRTAAILSEKAEQVEEELKLNKERGLYDASKLLSMKLILKTLEQYRQQLVKDNRLDRMKPLPLLRHLLPRIQKSENSSFRQRLLTLRMLLLLWKVLLERARKWSSLSQS